MAISIAIALAVLNVTRSSTQQLSAKVKKLMFRPFVFLPAHNSTARRKFCPFIYLYTINNTALKSKLPSCAVIGLKSAKGHDFRNVVVHWNGWRIPDGLNFKLGSFEFLEASSRTVVRRYDLLKSFFFSGKRLYKTPYNGVTFSHLIL